MEMKICPSCGTEYEPKERFCPRDGSALRTLGGTSDLVGQVVADRYHVLRKLGEGGMGQVYLAEHVKMGRKSAVKVMHPSMGTDPDAISRFNREASNASRINHPNVAAIYDFGETPDGLIYLAMEFVEGIPLTRLVEEQGALPAARAASIVRQTADALAAAHDMGIVHRDLKPDNIMITRDRQGADCVKVVDFGIAKAGAETSQKVTRTGLVVGTPEYMSPEQLAGDKLDGRSDVYSLGLVAFHMLTGTLPFPSDSAQESMIMRLTDRPRTLGEMRPEGQWPADLQVVMDRVLARDARERYQNAPEFARDLVRAVDRMPASALSASGTVVMGAGAPPAPTVPPTRVGGERGPAAVSPTVAAARVAPSPAAPSRAPLVAAGAVLLLALVGGGAWMATRGDASTPPATSATADTLAGATPGAGALPQPTTTVAAADSGASGEAPTQPMSRPAVGVPAPQPGPRTPVAPAATDGDASEAALGARLDRIEAQIKDVADDPVRARALLAEIDENLGRIRLPARRLVALKARADLLAALERAPEACRDLTSIRGNPAYARMPSSFRIAVEYYFTEESGPACQ